MRQKRDKEERLHTELKKLKQEREIEMIAQQKKTNVKRERQRHEESELLERIERLKIREKIIDRQRKQKEELKNKSSEEIEDQAMENRLKTLKKEEEEILKRINDKEEKKESVTKTKEVNTKSEADMMTKIERTILGKPYLPTFDGNQFEEWKFEVSCLLKSEIYPDYVISQLVRNALKGKARRVLVTLQPGASTREILKKIESIYGNVRSGDSLIHEFYSAKQSANESCTDWGIRLETIFYQAVDKGEVEESRKDNKLKERFWRGLYSDQLKNATRVTYESSDSFELLRKKARLEEVELDSLNRKNKAIDNESSDASATETKVHQPIRTNTETETKLDKILQRVTNLERQNPKEYQPIRTNPETESKLDTILNRMKDLERDVKELKSLRSSDRSKDRYNSGYFQSRGRARYRGDYGEYRGGYTGRHRYRGRGRSRSNHRERQRQPLESDPEKNKTNTPDIKKDKSDDKGGANDLNA